VKRHHVGAADEQERREGCTKPPGKCGALIRREIDLTYIEVEAVPEVGEHNLGVVAEVAPGVEMRFVRLQALIEMKEASGRPLDLDDARQLKWIADRVEEERDLDDAPD